MLTKEQRSEIALLAAATRKLASTPEQRQAAALKAAQTRRTNLAPAMTIKAQAIIDCVREKAKATDQATITPQRIAVIQIRPEPIAVNAKALLDTLKVLGGVVTLKRQKDGLVVSQDKINSRFWTPNNADMASAVWVDLWK